MQKLGTRADDVSTLSGDNTAYSVLVSRYMQAVQVEHGGLVLDYAAASLRTACLTGVAQRRMAEPMTVTISVNRIDRRNP